MSAPNDAEDGDEHTSLLAPPDDGGQNVGHSITAKLAGILPWSAPSGHPASSIVASHGARSQPHSPKAPSQQSTEVGSSTENDPVARRSATAAPATAPGGSNSATGATGNRSSSGVPQQAEPDRSSGGAHPGIEATPSWGVPAGLDARKATDQHVLLFRQAIGINITTSDADAADPEAASMEQNRKLATGIYGRILRERRTKSLQYSILSALVNTCHVVQILIGAALTSLGSEASNHSTAITALGATNTVLAGVFALLKGQGLPDRLHKDAIQFRRVQDWIEETDALLVSGVVGRDRKEVGLLVETAFKKYNAVLASEENNKPESYVQQQPEATRSMASASTSSAHGVGRIASPLPADQVDTDSDRDGNSVVRLNLPPIH